MKHQMRPGIEIIEDVTCADVAVRISAGSVEDLFVRAAQSLLLVMLDHPEHVEGRECRNFSLAADEIEMLLHAFLSEFLFFKDAESLLLASETVKIDRCDGGYRLECDARGEIIDKKKHSFNVDIKAVTFHRLEVKNNYDGWTAMIVFDV